MFLFVIVFLVDPESISVVEGTTVEFTCTADNTVAALLYIVDGVSASLNAIIQRGFTEQDTESLGNGVLRRNLTVITSTENNNNSEIYCRAFGSANTNSDTATLTIQGTVPMSS